MQFLKKQWFLIALGFCLLLGFTARHAVLAICGSEVVRYSVVAFVLFLMALPLEPTVIKKTLSKPWAAGLGIGFNIVLLPLFAWPIAKLIGGEYGEGLFVAVAAPCTMASAAVWTRRAGGNHAAAICVTVFTNFFCFLIMPFWVGLYSGESTNIAAGKMILKLALVVVLPMLIAQILRLSPTVSHVAKSQKPKISILAQCGILFMVAAGAAQTSERFVNSPADSFSVTQLAWVVLAANLIHITILFAGIWTAKKIGLSKEDCIAVGFAGSQKDLDGWLNRRDGFGSEHYPHANVSHLPAVCGYDRRRSLQIEDGIDGFRL